MFKALPNQTSLRNFNNMESLSNAQLSLPLLNQANSETLNTCPPVPRSIITASRYELTDVKLKIDGTLPNDLQGHMFIIEPTGSVSSGGLPYPDGNSILCGDGMIYRLDFNKEGGVRLKTRLIKPPDYYADQATQPGTKYSKYQFHSLGIARFSLFLGCRNQLNTAFLPVNFSDGAGDRLLVTYDAGRPYEIDTESLKIVTPIGANAEWKNELDGLNIPFQLFMSTAHPVFDAYTKKMFTVNFGRSLRNFLETIPPIYDPDHLPQEVNELISKISRFFLADFLKDIFKMFSKLFWSTFQFQMSLIEKIIGLDMQDFVYLICWDGSTQLERWKLVLSDRSPIRIQQCIHQIAVTEDYILIMDTAYSVGIDELINNPIPIDEDNEQFFKQLLERLRRLLECPSVPDSNIYIVRRSDLKVGQHPACSEQEVEVVVQKVEIPLSAAHFLVNYENPDDNITIHIAHICAMKVSDWLREYDLSAYPPHHPIPSHLRGMIHNEVDISRMGRYVISGETGQMVDSCIIFDDKCTWGVELYAYLDRLPTGLQPKKLDQIYWCSLGLWQELMTKFIVDLHKDYKHQLVPRSQVLDLAQKGMPSCLFRLDTQAMEIADSYDSPDGHMVLSPQFVPRGNGESLIDGYLVCTVFTPTRSEIWVFDAQNLAKGPLCKFYHPSLSFGFTLHTAWLPEIGSHKGSYYIGARDDYQDLVKRQALEIQELFEEEVYPHFEEDTKLLQRPK